MPIRRAPASCPCRCSSLLLVLATTPLWLARVGLYQYLALEVMIWMLFALGYNLLLGNTGLPSFGHGAFFGIGAYAFGLLQQRVLANLWFDLAGAVARRGAARRARRRLHLAPARHLLRAADDRLRPGVLVRRRSSGTASPAARTACSTSPGRCCRSASRRIDLHGNEALFYFCLGAVRGRRWSCSGGWCTRRSAGCSRAIRQNETARRLRRLQRLALQVAGVHHRRRRSPASPARCSRWRSSRPIPT